MTDKRPELAHGGIASREGDLVTLGVLRVLMRTP